MVNGFRYYRALESFSIASALSTALTIYPCQIRPSPSNADSLNSNFLQATARKKEWWPAIADTDSSPHAVTCQHCDTYCFISLAVIASQICEVGRNSVKQTYSSSRSSKIIHFGSIETTCNLVLVINMNYGLLV